MHVPRDTAVSRGLAFAPVRSEVNNMTVWPSLAVPVMNDELQRYPEQYIEKLKIAGADMVWLGIRRSFLPEYGMANLKQNISLLKQAGFAVGVWMQAFGFGDPVQEKELPAAAFQRITDVDGRVCSGGDAFCPTDPAFTSFLGQRVQAAAAAGADAIMLDDDLCLNIRPGLGCTCGRHMAEFEKRLGYSIDPAQLRQRLFTGQGTRERKIWLDVMGNSLRDFCREMRRAADEVDPSVRMGFCAGYTSWDLEGADALELTGILAGNNRPFLRLTGAPYWAENRRFPGQNMKHIVEFTRMQQNWCENRDVDIFFENDSYPRPAYKIPAAYLETFDFCLCAVGLKQLKYLMDYFSAPGYENGYLAAHLRNRPVIEATEKALENLEDAGIYIHEDMHKNAYQLLPENANNEQVMRTAFSAGADLLSGLGFPVKYRNDGGTAVAFGYAGRTVPANQKCYILDYTAAIELENRGIDTGLMGGVPMNVPRFEWFDAGSDRVQISGEDLMGNCSQFYVPQLRENARVESWFETQDRRTPASYSYINRQGTAFLVFSFRGDTVRYGGSLARSYYRYGQILDFLQRTHSSVPARLPAHPGAYQICRVREDTLGIAICNFSLDEMLSPTVELEACWDSAEFIGLEGSLEGNRLRLQTIPAYRFGTVLLKKSR